MSDRKIALEDSRKSRIFSQLTLDRDPTMAILRSIKLCVAIAQLVIIHEIYEDLAASRPLRAVSLSSYAEGLMVSYRSYALYD
jgi:hypothetical protein